MLPTFEPIHFLYLAIAIVLDVIANVLMKMANGFQHKRYVLAAIISVLIGFSSLSLAVKGIQLSVAYGIWGGSGLIATALLGVLLFGEKIRPLGWMGIILVMAGVALIKFQS